MTLKKIISSIISIVIIFSTLPVISFAEGDGANPYVPGRPSYEGFNPEATQEPFSNIPASHTEVIPDTIQLEDVEAIQSDIVINESDVIENGPIQSSDTNATVNAVSTTDSELWNSLMSERFGNAYLSPYKKSDGYNVSGRTNRLTICETDISLPGKNGLDLNIRRRYDNQFYNNGFVGARMSSYITTINELYVYRFISSVGNAPVYVGFLTEDDFLYYNMADGITVWEIPSNGLSKCTITLDGQDVYCYYFEILYNNKSDTGITLTYDDTFKVKRKSVVYSGYTERDLISYTLLSRKNEIDNDWFFEFPVAGLDTISMERVENSDNKQYLRSYLGAFKDIDGVIHQIRGEGTLTLPDEGDRTYMCQMYSDTNSFLTLTQYVNPITIKDTDVEYNFSIYDSSRGLTYYMYNTGIPLSNIKFTQSILPVAVVDKYNNMIHYVYDESYGTIMQIIDTYGRVLNFTYFDGGTEISYTDENGELQSVKYETETLSPTELDNDSPIAEKEVHRFKVTNQEGEVTIYDSREGEVLAYYHGAYVVPLYNKEFASGEAIQALTCDNIERIIYPNGLESRYKYKRIYTANKNIRVCHSSYAVIESYDILNGVKKNEKTYDYALNGNMVIKTETNVSTDLVTTYHYDYCGMLTESYASPAGPTSFMFVSNKYYYGENNQITAHIVNRNGATRTTLYSYAVGYPGMVMSVEEVNTSKTTYTYHTVDRKATLIPKITTVSSYSPSTYIIDYSIETQLDSNNRAVELERTIKNNVIESQTKYARDDYGRITAVTEWIDDTNGDDVLDSSDSTITTNTQYVENANGSITVINATDDVSTTYQYGVTGLPYSMTDPKGYTTQIEYDNVGRATKYIYPNGATETAEYNLESMFTNVKDKAGKYTKICFDGLGMPTVKYFLTPESTQIEECQYDDASRIIYKKTIYDIDKFTVERYTYDAFDRVSTRMVYDNDILLYTENYAYTSLSVTMTTTAQDGTVVATQKSDYDVLGRLIKKEQYTNDMRLLTTYTYDYRGNVLTETDPMGNVTTYTYDIFNNVTSVTYPDSSKEYMYYDMAGRNVTTVDKNSVEYRNTYDSLDRVTKTEVKVNDTYVTQKINLYDKNSNLTGEAINISPQSQTSQTNITYTNYVYDNMNNLVGIIRDDGNYGRNIQYWYDTAGRMTKMATGLPYYYGDNQLPDSAQITQYGYDIHGNMTSRTDQLGNVTTYTYDYAGNVKRETHANVTINKTYGPYGITSSSVTTGVGVHDYSYTYNSIGMMNSHTSYYGTETIGYDAFGRKTSETSNGRIHMYSYDKNSRLTKYQMKNGTTIENDIDYTYDNMGRTTLIDINDVTVNGETVTGAEIAYTYDINGNMTSKVQGINRTEVVYNQFNQPVSYTNKIGGTAISSYNYTYRWDGKILTESDTVNNTSKAYTYDFWGNLLKETIAGAVNRETTYTYDVSNNRASKTVTGDENYTTTYTYNKRNQLLTETKTENETVAEVMAYQYSSRGERTGKHITANGTSNVIAYYTWDGNGRLFQHDTGFSHPAGVSCVFYFYDALGRRIKKSGGSDSTDFTWSGEEEAGEIDANGNLTGRYIYGADGIVMNNDLYYFKNAHGDVTEIVDKDGTSTGVYRYEAFGEKMASPENDTNPFGYCGEYTDGESYLIYLRNRYYDSENGAFLSEDPICDGTNWYTYCENDPVNHVDPWGLDIYYFVNSQFRKEADKDKRSLSEYYDEPVHVMEVDTRETFIEEWNKMGSWAGEDVNVSLVVINMHGSPDGLQMKPGENIYTRDITDGTLISKYIDDILVLGCNSGHFDYRYTSLINKLLVYNNVNSVIASDGTVMSRSIFGNYKSVDDESFVKYLWSGKKYRENFGFTKYTKNEKGELEWDILGKKFTIISILKEAGIN